MQIPKPINKLIEHFERLPGIGPKTAQRLAFYLLRFPEEEIANFSRALLELKSGTNICSICRNVSEDSICSVCADTSRDPNTIAVVSSPLDVFALEKTGYRGVYHVLHGLIDPLNNVGPEDIYISDLVKRISEITEGEVILATNSSMEGESTAMYLSKLIRETGFDDSRLKITRIARGLPVGGDIEYADDITLSRAMDGRIKFS